MPDSASLHRSRSAWLGGGEVIGTDPTARPPGAIEGGDDAGTSGAPDLLGLVGHAAMLDASAQHVDGDDHHEPEQRQPDRRDDVAVGGPEGGRVDAGGPGPE